MTDPDSDLRQELHLLKQEQSALRELCENATRACSAAMQAYAALAQRTDLLETRLERRKTPR